MIRPSALQLAEKCGHAARLSAEHPEGSDATERGNKIHGDLRGLVKHPGYRPMTQEIQAVALEWSPPKGCLSELAVELRDPETGAVITFGTADLAWVEAGVAMVPDLKTGQPQFLPEPDDALQSHAYALAFALTMGLEAYKPGYLLTPEDEKPRWWWGEVVRGAEMWAWLDRIRAAANKGPDPIKGGHCTGCFARLKCKAHLLPADPVERDSALAPLASMEVATPAQVVKLHLASKALKEMAEKGDEYVKAWVAEHGPIVEGGKALDLYDVAGKRSVSVATVEAAGRADLITSGKPGKRLEWRNVKPHARAAK